METVTLTYNGRLPSANDLIAINRVNRYSGAALKKRYTQELARCFESQTKARFTNHVTCKVDFYEDSMRRDDDNVISGLKYVMDGLVEAKIIRDDSPRWCHVVPERHQSHLLAGKKKIPYITVQIVESDEEEYL